MNGQSKDSFDRLPEKLTALLRGPQHPEAEFLFSGRTFGEIFSMAGALQARFSLPDWKEKSICLSTKDRSLMAAAMLAAISCQGPHLIIPYSDSQTVLNEMGRQVPYDTALTDVPSHFPAGVSFIHLEPEEVSTLGLQQQRALNPDFPFLSLFTGGSTGRPKIWQKTIRNLFSEAFYLSEKFGFSLDDRIVATVPPYHIYGILFSVLVPLVSSASVMADTPTFPHEIINAIVRQKATVLVSVPIHYKTLAGSTMPNHSLRMAFSSAGALDKTDGKNFTGQTGTGITEIYGSTETGGIAYRCRAMDDAALTVFETVDVEIIDEQIHVRSDYISPNVSRDEDGFSRTGDRGGKFDPDRFILYGRSDGIVKIGGKRVDLEEIREKILSIPEVADALILSAPGSKGREHEIAAVLEGKISPKQVRKQLSKKLEPYAQPRNIKVVDRIPRNHMGKYDMEKIQKLFQPS